MLKPNIQASIRDAERLGAGQNHGVQPVIVEFQGNEKTVNKMLTQQCISKCFILEILRVAQFPFWNYRNHFS